MPRCKYCARAIWPWQKRFSSAHNLCLEIWHRGWLDHIEQMKKPIMGECSKVPDAG